MKNAYTFDQLSNEAKMRAMLTNEASWWFDQDKEEAFQDIIWSVGALNDSVGGIIESHYSTGELLYKAAPADFFEVVELIGTNAEAYNGATGYGANIAEAYNAVMRENAEKLQSLMEELEKAEEASHNTPMGKHDWHIYDVIEIQTSIAAIFDQAREKAAQEANEQAEAAGMMYDSIDEAEELLSCFYWTKDGEYIGAL